MTTQVDATGKTKGPITTSYPTLLKGGRGKNMQPLAQIAIVGALVIVIAMVVSM